jgi:hypothetical protein
MPADLAKPGFLVVALSSSGMRTTSCAIAIALAACTVDTSFGTYQDRGAGLTVTFVHTTAPRVSCTSEQMRQTKVYVELATAPADDQTIDLATLRVSLEYGGMRPVFHGERCRGTLKLGRATAETRSATIDVSCTDTKTGEERRLADSAVLAHHR